MNDGCIAEHSPASNPACVQRPGPPVNNAARQALAMGAALTVIALTVALVVYLLGSPPT